MTKEMLGLMVVVLFFFFSNPTCFFRSGPCVSFRLVWFRLVDSSPCSTTAG